MKTYISNIDELAHFSSRSSVVGKGVRRSSSSTWSSSVIETAGRWTTIATTSVATTSAVASSKATSATTKAASKPSASYATSKSATTLVTATGWTSKLVLTDLQHAALPVIAVELVDGVTRVLGVLECNNTGAFGTTIWA